MSKKLYLTCTGVDDKEHILDSNTNKTLCGQKVKKIKNNIIPYMCYECDGQYENLNHDEVMLKRAN